MLPFFLLCTTPVGICLVWLGICGIMARISGWGRFAMRFPATEEPVGTRFRMQSARIGAVDYNSGLTIIVAPEGVYIGIVFFFRFAHPPMFIPWSELHVLEVRNTWLSKDVKVSIGTPPIGTMRLPVKIVEAAENQRIAIAASGEQGT